MKGYSYCRIRNSAPCRRCKHKDKMGYEQPCLNCCNISCVRENGVEITDNFEPLAEESEVK